MFCTDFGLQNIFNPHIKPDLRYIGLHLVHRRLFFISFFLNMMNLMYLNVFVWLYCLILPWVKSGDVRCTF